MKFPPLTGNPSRNKTIFLMLGVLLTACSQQSDTPKGDGEKASAFIEFKAQPLNPDEEKKLIQAAQDQVTRDGATVLQVMKHVENMRAKEFKLASFEIFYSNDGKPSNVGVCYWIGSKRLDDDRYCDISFSFSPDYKSFKPEVGSATEDEQQDLTVIKLLKGRDAFLKNIDEFYEQTCVGFDKKKSC